jgi:ribonuclease G
METTPAPFQETIAGAPEEETRFDFEASESPERAVETLSEDRADVSQQPRDERGRREPRADRNPREPRSLPPAGATGPVYGAYPDLNETAPLEPIILPGESLSKYRPGGSNEPTSAAPAAPAPVPEFVLPAAWDGGLVLPGETIRPRGPAADAQRGSGDRGRSFEDGRNRDRRGGQPSGETASAREDRAPQVSVRPAQQPAPAAQAMLAVPPAPLPVPASAPDTRAAELSAPEPVPVVKPAPEHPAPEQQAPSSVGAAEPLPLAADDLSVSHQGTPPARSAEPLNSTFVAPPPLPHESAAAPAAEPEAEYEPTEGAISFRVDPVPPREFRQPAPPVAEPGFDQDPLVATELPSGPTQAGPASELPDDSAPQAAAPPAEQPELAALDAGELSAVPQEIAQHDITSISAAGDMHSKPVLEAAAEPLVHETAPPAEMQEVSPQEGYLHALHAEDMQGENEFASQQTLPAPLQPGHFEPGQGLLEEEVIDDEDEAGDLFELHGSAGAPVASATSSNGVEEQETLEGAADLGAMLRELSIDQITRTEPGLGDEEDEEEDFDDFLEEDLAEDELTGLTDDEGDDDEEFADEEAAMVAGADLSEPSPERSAQPEAGAAPAGDAVREPRREDSRREDRGRRDGRRGDRSRRGGGDRDRSASLSSSPERSTGGDRGRRDQHGNGRGRQSAQSTSLPAISELLKPGQEILVQIAKEPIAKKGARITSHIALPGRFLVFMPTVNHTGVSRKIESDSERRRLKEILLSEKGEAAGGFIVRTAASGASEEELRSDLRFLLNLWADIKQRSEASKSPALIYHDLNLVERVLRDQVTDTFSAIWVDNEVEYERVLRFLQRFQPSLIRRVKLYTKETPLFEQFGITEEINKALRSKVWLKSGGSIVINQTEALVAIDINTGKFVGKTARLEDTIVKTNLDAIPEIVRQIRLRDLGGIIIIDFIDMDERKNRNKVMAALEEELKSDRAPSKVLQFNDFGLVAITRKRVKQSLERTLSTTCAVCAGTGMVKSPVTVCNDIYIEMRKMQKHLDRGDVMLRVHPEVVKQLKSGTSKWLQEMEEMVGKTILVKSDPSLHPEQFDIH